jgi:tetratricopeptide (TPR) repeat protein
VLGLVAVRWSIGGRTAEALQLAREAVEIARANGDQDAEVEALNNLAVAQVNLGDLWGGLETSRACLELALECGASDLPRPYVNLATFEYDTGDLEAASRHHAEGLALAERLGHGASIDWLGAERVLDRYELGFWDEVLRDVRTLVGSRRQRGVLHYMDNQLIIIEVAIVLAREGRLLDDLLEEVLERVRPIGDLQLLAPALSTAAGLLATAGRVDEARGRLTEYLDTLRANPAWFGGGAALVTGAVSWCELMAEPVPDELLRGPDVPWTEASRLVAAGRPSEAADVLAAIGARTIEADVRLHAGRVLARSNPREAVHNLDAAAAFLREVEATARLVAVDEVRARLRTAAS